jgi:hypothetical protein
MNDNLLKAARRLLDAAEGDHNQMTQTDAGHYEFELDLAIRCFKDAHKEYMEQQAEPVIAVVTESGDFSATVGWTLNSLPVDTPLYESPPQQAEPNKGNG